jgi:hypothetical protein
MAKELLFYKELQKQLPDLPGFVEEACRRLNELGQEAFSDLGDVRDIKTQGDEAVGYWIPAADKQPEQPPADERQPVHFCKIGGRWYITIPDPPPPLSVNERAAQLHAEIETLWVVLCCSGPATPAGKNKYGEVRMSVRPFVYKSDKPTLRLIRLSPAQAKKLIDHLATEGYLQQAVELGKQEIPERDLSEFCYTLQVSTRSLELHEDLGWGPGLVKRLKGLRGALDEEASHALGSIIAELAGEQKKTE